VAWRVAPALDHLIVKETETVNLSFKVPAQVRKRFKLAAIHAGITQNELVQRMLAAWEAQHPTR
jgi:hypothetical protein